MSLLQKYIDFIKEKRLFQSSDRLLATVSGGLDSVVLAHLCREAGFSVAIAHCNFGLRGEESDRDEAFARELAEKMSVPFFTKRFETRKYAEEKKLSIQVAARELRYAWFREIADRGLSNESKGSKESSESTGKETDGGRGGRSYIVTAHHRDDNIETVLMNFCKGTGIAGLHGILPKQGDIVRPLLFASREEILAYATEHSLQWVEDSSNEETKYTRNHFRHNIIPAIEKVYPQLRENIVNNITRLGEVEVVYKQAMETTKKKLLEKRGEEVYIPVLKLQKSLPLYTIAYEIFQQYGFTSAQVGEVIKLLSSESGKYISSETHQVIRHRAWLIIAPIKSSENNLYVIEKGTETLRFGDKWLHLKSIALEKAEIINDPTIALLDSKEVEYPLILRRWKAGDYFYPLGMKKKKKLARFFIDQKLSKTEKESVWVLESHKKIVWVVGYRIDDRFKITPSSKNVLKLTVSTL